MKQTPNDGFTSKLKMYALQLAFKHSIGEI